LEFVNSNVYIDPSLDLFSDEMVTIIIHFKTEPAKVAMSVAKKSGVALTNEEASAAVAASHARFLEDMKIYLGQHHVPYAVTYSYTEVFNGVAMKLPSKEIKRMLQSAEIKAIYANKEYHLDPPVQPKDYI
jgi:hypothetical protein